MTERDGLGERRMQFVDRETLLYGRIPRVLMITFLLGVLMFAAFFVLQAYDLDPIMWFFAGMAVVMIYTPLARRLRTW